MLNAVSWTELKKQLRPLEGKAIFELNRVNSFNDGKFQRKLYKVHPHKLIFLDEEQNEVYLYILKDTEDKITFFENGFRMLNCTYTIKEIKK